MAALSNYRLSRAAVENFRYQMGISREAGRRSNAPSGSLQRVALVHHPVLTVDTANTVGELEYHHLGDRLLAEKLAIDQTFVHLTGNAGQGIFRLAQAAHGRQPFSPAKYFRDMGVNVSLAEAIYQVAPGHLRLLGKDDLARYRLD